VELCKELVEFKGTELDSVAAKRALTRITNGSMG